MIVTLMQASVRIVHLVTVTMEDPPAIFPPPVMTVLLRVDLRAVYHALAPGTWKYAKPVMLLGVRIVPLTQQSAPHVMMAITNHHKTLPHVQLVLILTVVNVQMPLMNVLSVTMVTMWTKMTHAQLVIRAAPEVVTPMDALDVLLENSLIQPTAHAKIAQIRVRSVPPLIAAPHVMMATTKIPLEIVRAVIILTSLTAVNVRPVIAVPNVNTCTI